MTAPVEVEQAHQLRRAEAEWLRQSAARLRAAHAAADRAGDRAAAGHRADAGTTEESAR
jgi:hypothetical protein